MTAPAWTPTQTTMRRLHVVLLIVLCSVSAHAADPPAANSTNLTENIIGPPIPPRPIGYEALSWTGRADRLLRDHDDIALTETYNRAIADNAGQAMLDWAGRHLTTNDRHAIIADLIGRSYEQGAAAQPDPVKHTEALRRATIYKIIALAITLVDGAACTDPSARQEHVDQRITAGRDILAWAKQAPLPLRQDILTRAMGVEAATFPKAPPDPGMCWAGHDIWQHADAAHAKTLASHVQDGRTVTLVYVPTQPGWSPPLRDDALAARQAAHDGLRPALEKLLGME